VGHPNAGVSPLIAAEYATEGVAKLRGIIAGRRDGVRYIEDHPDEAAGITAKAFNGNPALYRRVFGRYVTIHYWSEGKFDYDAERSRP
jgi:NitT/TauT family transport system substrate-binding protein